MEQKLYDAAVAGNVASLADLIKEDPLLLVKATLNCQDMNPLHIAAIFGHIKFVKEILQKNSDMCLVPDRFGRNPLHLAAVNGRLDVLKELIHARPLAAREKTAGGDTVLHLCIKYNQLEALEYLVKTIKDHEFANMKNGDGMTVLHLAICNKQNEPAKSSQGESTSTENTTSSTSSSGLHEQIIKYLLQNKIVKVNALNANGNTALDLFQEDTDTEIARSLKIAGAKKGKKIAPQEVEWLTKKRDALMVVASLIATMAFQAAVTPPGGVWQEDSKDSNGPNPHKAGEAVMAHNDDKSKYYRYFVRANTVAFASSLSIILLLISGLPYQRNKFFTWFLTVVMWTTVTSAALTYGVSVLMVTPEGDQSKNLTKIGVTVWSGVMGLLLLGNTIRLLNRWLKFHGIDLLRKIKHWYWAVPEKTNDMQENIPRPPV